MVSLTLTFELWAAWLIDCSMQQTIPATHAGTLMRIRKHPWRPGLCTSKLWSRAHVKFSVWADDNKLKLSFGGIRFQLLTNTN